METRRPSFPFPDGLDAAWNPRLPEFAFAANGISMLMPYAEPFLIRSVRAVLDRLEEPLATEAREWIRQEATHHQQHRRFNEVITAGSAGLGRVERAIAKAYDLLGRVGTARFHLAGAAASEAFAFSIARWVEDHLDLFDGADPAARDLFLWHLAEEVEHKSVVFDVYSAVFGGRVRYALTGMLSLALVGIFTMLTVGTMLVRSRRALLPVAWWRLAGWSASLFFRVMPDLLYTARRGHHPGDLADPVYLMTWLQGFDADAATTPALVR